MENRKKNDIDKKKEEGVLPVHMALTAGLAVFFMTWGGHWLDERFGTGIMFTAGLAAWSIIGSIVWIWIRIRKLL